MPVTQWSPPTSPPLLASKRPSESITAHVPSRKVTRVHSWRPVATSQRRVVPSALPVRRRVPSFEKATERTPRALPSRRPTSFPVAVAQKRTVSSPNPFWSPLAVTTLAPSGENATDVTHPACP